MRLWKGPNLLNNLRLSIGPGPKDQPAQKGITNWWGSSLEAENQHTARNKLAWVERSSPRRHSMEQLTFSYARQLDQP